MHNANTVKAQLSNAKQCALDATKTFVSGIEVFAVEAAELSQLANLPPTVRAALSRLDQAIRNEMGNINDIITRTHHDEPRQYPRLACLDSPRDPSRHD